MTGFLGILMVLFDRFLRLFGDDIFNRVERRLYFVVHGYACYGSFYGKDFILF